MMNDIQNLFQQVLLWLCSGGLICILFFASICGIRMFVLRYLSRGWIGSFVSVLFLIQVISVGATKYEAGLQPPSLLIDTGSVSVLHSDVLGLTTSDSEVENGGLFFRSIARTDDSVVLDIGWTPGRRFVRDTLFLRANTSLEEDNWSVLTNLSLKASWTNLVCEIHRSAFHEANFNAQGFFRIEGDEEILDQADNDHDGAPDWLEEWFGSDPLNPDTDDDGLLDGVEIGNGTNPCNPDTDGDGVSDFDEVDQGTDPYFPTENLAVPDGPHYEMIGSNVYSTVFIDQQTMMNEDALQLLSATEEASVIVPGITYYEPGSQPVYSREGCGASIRALHTGRFTFKYLVPDDIIRLRINDMDYLGDYYGGRDEASTVLIAGQSYPVTISAFNRGGPAELSFAKWALFSPVSRIALNAEFTKKVIVFESSYLDVGNRMSPGKSSKSILRIAAKGGQFGGRLSISRQDYGRLRSVVPEDFDVTDGEIIPPGNETHVWTIPFEGARPSQTLDDAQFVFRFEENLTGDVVVQTAKVTSVEVSVEAMSSFPRQKWRHVFGPHEDACIKVKPDVFESSFYCGGNALRAPQRRVTLPGFVGAIGISGLVSDVPYSAQLNVIAPTGSRAISFRPSQAEDWTSKNGAPPIAGEVGAGLLSELVITPSYVSFGGIFVEEGVCEASGRWGFFTNANIRLPRHDPSAGAGIRCNITYDNCCESDLAGCVFTGITPPVDRGGFTYEVPLYWYVRNGFEDGPHNFICNEPVVYIMESNGDFKVERFGNSVTRSINGSYR